MGSDSTASALKAWEELLGRMEAQLAEGQKLLADPAALGQAQTTLPGTDFELPENMPPIPAQILPRVQALISAQESFTAALGEQLEDLRKQRRAVERADQRAESSPVYLNVEG